MCQNTNQKFWRYFSATFALSLRPSGKLSCLPFFAHKPDKHNAKVRRYFCATQHMCQTFRGPNIRHYFRATFTMSMCSSGGQSAPLCPYPKHLVQKTQRYFRATFTMSFRFFGWSIFHSVSLRLRRTKINPTSTPNMNLHTQALTHMYSH